jgi:CheY-like chemotaxis protein
MSGLPENPVYGCATKRKRILLVDDSKTVILMERMILAPLPYDLIEAGDGEAGVDAAQRLHPDLILMDVIMPRMNGFEACRRLRAVGEGTASIPIILVSTAGDERTIRTGREAGCNDHLTKPINGNLLLAKVKRFLDPVARAL